MIDRAELEQMMAELTRDALDPNSKTKAAKIMAAKSCVMAYAELKGYTKSESTIGEFESADEAASALGELMKEMGIRQRAISKGAMN